MVPGTGLAPAEEAEADAEDAASQHTVRSRLIRSECVERGPGRVVPARGTEASLPPLALGFWSLLVLSPTGSGDAACRRVPAP